MHRIGLILLLWLAGCATLPPAPVCHPDAGPYAWVLERSWHTEIALPTSLIAGPLAPLSAAYPGAETLVFGFGKRSWMLAEADGELLATLAGPFPGEGVMQVIPLRGSPAEAFPTAATILRIPLSPAQFAALEASLAESFGPRFETVRVFPGSRFFAASHGYSLGYTCNGWTADRLERAGLAIRAAGVKLTGGVMRQAARLPGACR
jgi:hypothetical protein